jgi:hypothetical protein
MYNQHNQHNQQVLVINTKFNALNSILANFCEIINEKYEININILQHIIKNIEFLDMFEFIYEQYTAKYMKTIHEFKIKYLHNPDMYIHSDTGCGYIININDNTTVKYCNKTSKEHKHKSNNNINTHPFIAKTKKEIIKNIFRNNISTLYKNCINNIIIGLYDIFINHICHNTCRIYKIYIPDNENNDKINNENTNKKNVFHDKHIRYEYANSHTPPKKWLKYYEYNMS